MNCEVCGRPVEEHERVKILTEGIDGYRVMHQSCFDDVWSTWSNRPNIDLCDRAFTDIERYEFEAYQPEDDVGQAVAVLKDELHKETM